MLCSMYALMKFEDESMIEGSQAALLGDSFPFCSAIALFKNQPFPRLERRVRKKKNDVNWRSRLSFVCPVSVGARVVVRMSKREDEASQASEKQKKDGAEVQQVEIEM